LPNINAALRAVQAFEGDGVTVGFAIYGSNGQMLAGYDATSENYGGSITKAMLLVAYLQQIGDGTLSPEAQDELESMIEVSDNDAADWVYDDLSSPNSEVQSVADSVGMTGFKLGSHNIPRAMIRPHRLQVNVSPLSMRC
jgi:beta-lactamase class A